MENNSTYTSSQPNNVIDISQLPVADNALVWYAALLPILAKFFDNYTANKYHGALLWILVIVVRIAVCIYDNKKLIKLGIMRGQISPMVFLPSFYIMNRCKTLMLRSKLIVVISFIAIANAFVSNGFVKGLAATDETYCSYVKDYYSSYITNLPEDENFLANTDETLDGLISQYCGEENAVTYASTKSGDAIDISASSVCTYNDKENQKLEIIFSLDYDGYKFNGMSVDSINVGNKELTGDEKDTLLKDLFMTEK